MLSILIANHNEPSGFLTTSQTFFGVISTVIVLCLFMDPSNFIYKILLGFKSIFLIYSAKKIKIIRINIKRKICVLRPLLRMHSDSVKDKNPILYEEGVVILDNLGLMNLKIEGKIKDLNKSINNLFKFCSKAQEQVMAPLYTFMFCIVVFCCDEIFSVSDGIVVTNVLFFFTILSYIFWLEIWRCYFERTKPTNVLFIKKRMKRNKYDLKEIAKRFIIIIVCWIFIFFLFYVLNLFFTRNYILYITMLIVIAVSFYVFFRVYHNNIFLNKKYNYSIAFVFSHFICILLLSIFNVVVLIIINWLDSKFIYMDLFLGTNCLKCVVLSFALLNGLIIPFIAPLSRFLLYKKYIRNKIYEIENDSINSSNKVVSEYTTKVKNVFHVSGKSL